MKSQKGPFSQLLSFEKPNPNPTSVQTRLKSNPVETVQIHESQGVRP
jgi:hypothetical protein